MEKQPKKNYIFGFNFRCTGLKYRGGSFGSPRRQIRNGKRTGFLSNIEIPNPNDYSEW